MSVVPDSSAPDPDAWVLAIDQGGHASRAFVFDMTGKIVAQSHAAVGTRRLGEDRVEHDPVELLQSIHTAVADVVHALGDDMERIACCGLATQRSSIVCWDRTNGAALSPIISWQDRRNAAWLRQLQPHAAELRDLTGLVLSPHYGASKLRWCLDELAEVRQARADGRLALGPLAAFLLHHLLIEQPFCVDPANASRTQLYDPAQRTWAPRALDYFGVPVGLLPECVESRRVFGHLELAGRKIPLSVCTGDQSAVPFAFGRFDGRAVYANVGTGAFLQTAVASDVSEHPQLLRSVVFASRDELLTVVEGTVNGAASALDWLNERIGIDTHRAAHALTRAAVGEQALPIFINGVSGVGSPYWLPLVESHFEGEGTESAQVAAVVESIAFLMAANIELMIERQAVGQVSQRIVMTGGLAHSDYLCECLSTLTGLVVQRMELREATATGLGYLLTGNADSWGADVSKAEFLPASSDSLLLRYRRWRGLMTALAATATAST